MSLGLEQRTRTQSRTRFVLHPSAVDPVTTTSLAVSHSPLAGGSSLAGAAAGTAAEEAAAAEDDGAGDEGGIADAGAAAVRSGAAVVVDGAARAAEAVGAEVAPGSLFWQASAKTEQARRGRMRRMVRG